MESKDNKINQSSNETKQVDFEKIDMLVRVSSDEYLHMNERLLNNITRHDNLSLQLVIFIVSIYYFSLTNFQSKEYGIFVDLLMIFTIPVTVFVMMFSGKLLDFRNLMFENYMSEIENRINKYLDLDNLNVEKPLQWQKSKIKYQDNHFRLLNSQPRFMFLLPILIYLVSPTIRLFYLYDHNIDLFPIYLICFGSITITLVFFYNRIERGFKKAKQWTRNQVEKN